ncbi:hypothetical protein I7I50_04245 [Histoplasma capsulatum G186AR]|uniref:Uncharacterized protein n=1 Tax=Ajellomyces capsulatus TaxID=5037 RepID=A0A8H7YPA7_AJECA|nr:hypothetical protein I7I52_05153 [Histoplasma capsulatum]QSS75190.1 hypothetical protein I7I50_04245 [Histoplasma capsulatum G186AR]
MGKQVHNRMRAQGLQLRLRIPASFPASPQVKHIRHFLAPFPRTQRLSRLLCQMEITTLFLPAPMKQRLLKFSLVPLAARGYSLST